MEVKELKRQGHSILQICRPAVFAEHAAEDAV
jgi:hypothetical protein